MGPGHPGRGLPPELRALRPGSSPSARNGLITMPIRVITIAI
jgi:hypothetical protein